MDRVPPTPSTYGTGYAYFCHRCDVIAGSFMQEEGDHAHCAYCGVRPFVFKGGRMTHSQWTDFCDRFFEHYGEKRNRYERIRST